MYTINFINAKSMMKNNILRSFTVYVSEYLSLLLFITSLISVIYLFLFDTTFLDSLGVYSNDIILGIVSFFAVAEIMTLYFVYYYFRLKKVMYYSLYNRDISFYETVRYSMLCIIAFVRKLFNLFVFMSPFMLMVSFIFLNEDNGLSSEVMYILVGCASLLFISGLCFFRMYILKYSLISYVYANNSSLSFSSVFRISDDITDGKIIRLFILKIINLPKRILSLLFLPAFYYLPCCLFCEYDFLLTKENPYSFCMNTEKSVVFYMKGCEEC